MLCCVVWCRMYTYMHTRWTAAIFCFETATEKPNVSILLHLCEACNDVHTYIRTYVHMYVYLYVDTV